MPQKYAYIPGVQERMKQVLHDNNITVKDFAKKVGFNRNVFYDATTPSTRIIYLFCSEMKVSADYILGLRSEK